MLKRRHEARNLPMEVPASVHSNNEGIPQLVTEIYDHSGNVVGRLDLRTMRPLEPHPELDKAINAGRDIFIQAEGLNLYLGPGTPKIPWRERV